MCLFHTFVISLPFFFLFQNNTDKNMTMVQSLCYALRVLLYWTTWNSSYLWGNAFVFSLWEKERHSLQSRIRQKSSVEVLCCWTPLKGAESSAHCCGFFTVTSLKDLSIFFSGRPGLQLLNPCRQVKMRRLQLQGKEKQENKNIWYFSPRHFETPAATDPTTSGVFVVGDKQCGAVYCQALSTPKGFPQWFQSSCFVSKAHGKAPTDWGSGIVRCTDRDHPVMSTQAPILWCLSILITSLRRVELLVNEAQKWCRGRRAKLRPSLIWTLRYCIWLPTCFSLVGETVPISWLYCGMKLLFETIMVRPVQHQVELRGCSDGAFHYTKNKAIVCCWSWSLVLTRLYSMRVTIHLELYE